MTFSNVVTANGGPFEVDPANAHIAIQAAIDSLPAVGGVIECYGGATWTMTTYVTVVTPNVTIRFNHVPLSPSTGMGRAFQIQAAGFWVYGANIAYTGATTTAHAFFLFTEGATDFLCNNAGIMDSTFSLRPTTAADRIHAIQVIGSSGKAMQGFAVHNCTFIGQEAAALQTTSYSGVEPWGFIPIRIDHCEQVSISHCKFQGEPGVGPGGIPLGRMSPCIWLQDTRFVPITGCTFSYIETTALDGTQGCLVYVNATVVSEGHHGTFTGNVTELVAVDTLFRLVGANFNAIAGNNFGRNSAGGVAGAVQPRGTLYLSGGSSNVFTGNNVHNTGSTSPIIVDGTRNVLVVGNDFSLLDPAIPIFSPSNGATVEADPATNSIARQT